MYSLQHTTQMIESMGYIKESLQGKLKMSQVGSFDIFVSLLSSTSWNSARELSNKWIDSVAPDEWQSLQFNTTDTPSVTHTKQALRDEIIEGAHAEIYHMVRNPTLLQQLSTRLLVREKLMQDLPVIEYDRILSAEFGAPYRTWQQILGALALHPELKNILQVSDSLRVKLDDAGNAIGLMTYHGKNLLPETISGVGVYSSKITSSSEGGRITPVQSEQYIVTLTQEILSRCDHLIGIQEHIDDTRRIIMHKIGDITVWKKRGGGGNDPVMSNIPAGQLSLQ